MKFEHPIGDQQKKVLLDIGVKEEDVSKFAIN